MEFTLRTPEGFVGRIYAYGFYDRLEYRDTIVNYLSRLINILDVSSVEMEELSTYLG